MEGDAGTSRLNPTDADADSAGRVVSSIRRSDRTSHEVSRRAEPTNRPMTPAAVAARARLGGRASAPRCWLLAAGAACGGYFALRSHDHERGDRARRCGGAAGRQGLRGGDTGAGHRGDDRQPVEDHRVLDGRFRRAGQPVQQRAGRGVPGRQRRRCRCPTCGRRSSGTTTTARSTSWWRCASR